MLDLDFKYFETAVSTMREHGFEFAPGLSAQQIRDAELTHDFLFPPDLRAFLEYALPVSQRFPDWRDPESESILNRLAGPADGICFDIEHAAFWPTAWGKRPESLEAAKAQARVFIRAAPFLIPVFAHRYLPAVPSQSGNPIFSVHQTDIIYYGYDLPSYLFNEFNVPNPFPVPESPREIELWSELESLVW